MEGDLVCLSALYGVGSACVGVRLQMLPVVSLKWKLKNVGGAFDHSTLTWCDWLALEQAQNQIFSLLDTNGIGVSLSENKLMLPLKSLSMVMGFGANLTQQGSICDYCASRDICKHRRKRKILPFRLRLRIYPLGTL